MTLPTPDRRISLDQRGLGRRAALPRASSAAAQHLFTSRQLALPGLTPRGAPALASVGVDARSPDAREAGSRQRRAGSETRATCPADASEQRPDGDAIVSNEPGLALAVMVADCVPILLADPVDGAAAAIHAGWRGTCARVAPAAIERMQREFGTDPGDLIAAIGPSVGPDDYEVGESLVEAFPNAGHSRATSRAGSSAAQRAAPRFVVGEPRSARRRGRPSRSHLLGRLSTRAHPEVFDSFRAEGERAGRMAAIIGVPPGTAFSFRRRWYPSCTCPTRRPLRRSERGAATGRPATS